MVGHQRHEDDTMGEETMPRKTFSTNGLKLTKHRELVRQTLTDCKRISERFYMTDRNG